MYFRFGAAIVLTVAISLVGVALEKQSLAYRRGIARQNYRLDVLVEHHAQLRLKAQRLGAPARTIKTIEESVVEPKVPRRPVSKPSH